jgi:hypothetical protein
MNLKALHNYANWLHDSHFSSDRKFLIHKTYNLLLACLKSTIFHYRTLSRPKALTDLHLEHVLFIIRLF